VTDPDSRVFLAELGWDAAFAAAFSAYDQTCRPGRVARVDRSACTVLAENATLRATPGGDLLAKMSEDPANGASTGDWCAVREWADGRTTLEAVLPRHAAVARADVRGRSRGQVLAANVDVVGVVAALQPEPSLGKLERLLALAWESGATPLVLLTKADLVADARLVADDVALAAPGVQVICLSTVTGAGFDELRDALGPTGTLALVGSSGAGKSSLVNELVGAEVLETKEIRDDGKGRHTSVRRELVVLPGGGCVIDTPGLRGVGLIDADEGVAATFADLEALVGECRFSDCGHSSEPGCAVLAAVADGTLPVRRLESWRKLQREMEWMAARTDARLRSERARQWKQIARANRGTAKGRP
jgi:ribosome biogenesis GTPase / thiamine phosphate phosphatase